MSIQYERDDARRRVKVTVQGTFEKSDMLAIIERQRAEDTWAFGLFVDMRLMTGRPTIEDLREVMGQATSQRRGEGRRGPVAILAIDPVLYSVACSYAALGRSKLTIEVFRDWNEADHWLIEHASS